MLNRAEAGVVYLVRHRNPQLRKTEGQEVIGFQGKADKG